MKCAQLECMLQNLNNSCTPKIDNVNILKYTIHISLCVYVQVPREKYFVEFVLWEFNGINKKLV